MSILRFKIGTAPNTQYPIPNTLTKTFMHKNIQNIANFAIVCYT